LRAPKEVVAQLQRLSRHHQFDVQSIEEMRKLLGAKVTGLHEIVCYRDGGRNPNYRVELEINCDNEANLLVTMGHAGCRVYGDFVTLDGFENDGLSYHRLELTNLKHLIGQDVTKIQLAVETARRFKDTAGVLIHIGTESVGCDFFADIYYDGVERYNVELNPDWSGHSLVDI